MTLAHDLPSYFRDRGQDEERGREVAPPLTPAVRWDEGVRGEGDAVQVRARLWGGRGAYLTLNEEIKQ